jgi:transposase
VDTNEEDYSVSMADEEKPKQVEKPAKEKKWSRRATPEFKANVIAMVLEDGQSPDSVAKALSLSRSVVYGWVKQARIDRGQGKAMELTTDERRRLVELEAENRQLKMERELLKKWVAFSAKEMSK